MSSDSGCEVSWEAVDHMPAHMEDALQTWAFRSVRILVRINDFQCRLRFDILKRLAFSCRIDSVLRQEVERARQVTEVAKRSLILAGEE